MDASHLKQDEGAMDPQEIAALEWGLPSPDASSPPIVTQQVAPVVAEAQKRTRNIAFKLQSPDLTQETLSEATEMMSSKIPAINTSQPPKDTDFGSPHYQKVEGGTQNSVAGRAEDPKQSWPSQRGVTWAKDVTVSVNGVTADKEGRHRPHFVWSVLSCCTGYKQSRLGSEHNEGAVMKGNRGWEGVSARYGPGKRDRCMYTIHRVWKLLQLALSSKVLLWLWCILGVGVASFVLIKGVMDWKHTQARRLLTTCELQARLLEGRFKENVVQLAEFRGLMLPFYANPVEPSAPLLTQAQFYAFAKQTHQARPLVQNVGFVLKVLDKDRAAFEKAQNSSILDFFTGQPRAHADEYAPILFAEGIRPPGLLDANQDPVQRTVLIRSMQSGEVALSEPYSETLVLFRNVSFGAGYPIFRNIDVETATVAQREANIVGWLGASLNFKKIVELVLMNDTLSSNTLTWIYDCTQKVTNASSTAIVLFDPTHGQPVHHHGFAKVSLNLADPARRYEMLCSYAGHTPIPARTIEWTIAVIALVVLVSQLLRISGNRIQTLEDTFENVRSMNQQLLEAKVAAESADTIKSQFLATVSHEIRTPLNGVLGMLSLLRDTRLDTTQLDYIQTARASGKSLMVLINDVLDFSKIEAGRMDIESVPFDLRAELDDVIGLFGESTRAKGVELAALVQPGVPPVLLGDASRFRQVLVNLIGNATKFTDQGHIFVSVRLANLDEDLEQTHEIPLPKYLRKSRGAASGNDDDVSDGEQSAASSTASSPRHADDSSFHHDKKFDQGHGGSFGNRMVSRMLPVLSFAKSRLTHLQSNQSSSIGMGIAIEPQSKTGTEVDPPGAFDALLTPPTAFASSGLHTEEPGSAPTHTLSGRAAANMTHTYVRVARWIAAPRSNLLDDALSGSRTRGSDNAIPSRKGILSARKGMVRLAIAVEDTGQGIPKAAQQRIFQPWIQADSSTSRRAGGTGIGLTISNRLVSLMGGKMQFVSKPNVGTTFYFDLQLGMPPNGVAKAAPPVENGSGEPLNVPYMGRLAGLRVLCVDSHLLRREVLAGHLAGLGMLVDVVSTAQEAVTLVTTGQPASGGNLSSFGSTNTSGPLNFLVDTPNHMASMHGKYGSGSLSRWGPELVQVEPYQHGRGLGMKSPQDQSMFSKMANQGGSQPGSSAHGGSLLGASFAAVIVDSDCACHQDQGLEVPPMLEKALGGVPGCLPPMVLLMQRPDDVLEQEAREAHYGATLLKPLRRTAVAAALLQALGYEAVEGNHCRSQTRSSAGASLADILKGKRILCVDDNPVNRRVASKMLAKYGVETLSASSGALAIEVMRPPHDIDLVLMDIQMPEMDGYEACQKIRQLEDAARNSGMVLQNVPIVAMTADVLKGTRELCLEAGMDGYITKPMDSTELYNLVVKFFPFSTVQ